MVSGTFSQYSVRTAMMYNDSMMYLRKYWYRTRIYNQKECHSWIHLIIFPVGDFRTGPLVPIDRYLLYNFVIGRIRVIRNTHTCMGNKPIQCFLVRTSVCAPTDVLQRIQALKEKRLPRIICLWAILCVPIDTRSRLIKPVPREIFFFYASSRDVFFLLYLSRVRVECSTDAWKETC